MFLRYFGFFDDIYCLQQRKIGKFSIPKNTLWVILEMVFPANHVIKLNKLQPIDTNNIEI